MLLLVGMVKLVQVKMVKFHLGLECGPLQSYLFLYFSIRSTILFMFFLCKDFPFVSHIGIGFHSFCIISLLM